MVAVPFRMAVDTYHVLNLIKQLLNKNMSPRYGQVVMGSSKHQRHILRPLITGQDYSGLGWLPSVFILLLTA